MAGGLAAVIWTDFIQTVLMIIGAIVLSALGRLKSSVFSNNIIGPHFAAFTHQDIRGYEGYEYDEGDGEESTPHGAPDLPQGHPGQRQETQVPSQGALDKP